MTGTLTAVRSNADIREDELLGFLEFHTVAPIRIHKDELGALFNKNGLSHKFLPDAIRPHDAFRRATKQAQCAVDVNYQGTTRKARLLVREVVSTKEAVIRHLVREVVDSGEKRLSYDTIGVLTFNRIEETFDTSCFLKYQSEYDYNDFIDSIRDTFIDWTEYHTKDTINNIVRRVIRDMNHIGLMPSGKVTFIPRSQKDILDGLRSLIQDLEPFHTTEHLSSLEVIPVIDTLDQRQLVKKRVEAEIQMEANVLLADFAEVLDQRSDLNVRTVKGYAKRVIGLNDKLQEYEHLIHEKMSVLQNQLDDALARITSSR